MSLFTELKRRNVIRVGAAYVAVSWLIVQVVETLGPVFGLGDTAIRAVVILLVVGFIPTVIVSWAFELTPQGFKRDHEVDRASLVSRQMAKRLDRIIMVVLALALGYFAFDRFVLVPQREATLTEAARQAGRSEALVESYGDKSIAVLPFADLSPERDQAYFSDGIAEELLNLLAQVNNLRVISRSSSFSLRDAGLSIPAVAERLNVSYVLEGSVRKAGDRVRIAAQLIEARSDTHLWSETYDRTLDDVFAIQDQIAAEVVQELKVRLLGSAPASQITSTAAYELYLQGLSLFAKRSGTSFSPLGGGGLHLLVRRGGESVQEAIGLFEQATAIDPTYAPAHASLGLATVLSGCGHRRCESDSDKSQRHARAEAAASRALAVDPDNSDALATLGWIRYEQAQIEQSRAYLQRAIDSNPNSPLGYRWLGVSYENEDPIRNLALVQTASRLDPLDSTIHFDLATALLRLGRSDEAMDVARRRLALDPTDSSAYMLAAQIHWERGEHDLALKSYYVAYRADPGRRTYLGTPHILMGFDEPDLAEIWLEELKQRTELADYGTEALIAYLRGRTEEAVEIISSDYDQWQAFWILVFTRDFERVRHLYEQGFAKMGRDIARFDPALWRPFYIDYALILQRTGEPQRARDLIREIKTVIEKQLAQGVKVANVGGWHLRFELAQLHAMSGATEEAVRVLRRAVQDGFGCWGCVHAVPHFDSIRENPAFVAFVSEMEEKHASQRRRQRQRLIDEGLLLTPAEVMALEEISFDPFAG